MLKLIASTTIEGGATIELFQTYYGYAVRYGLEVGYNTHIAEARERYSACIAHALNCVGHPEETA
jgi:hypothetical protein